MKLKIFTLVLLAVAIMGWACDMRWENGMKLLKEGKYDEALPRFQTLAQDFPDVYQYQLMLGQCLMKLKETEKAKEAFKKAYELKPDSTDVAFAYAQILQMDRDYDTMALVLGKIDENQVTGEAKDKLHYLRGLTGFYQKKYDVAAADLAKIKNEQYRDLSNYYLAYSYYYLDRLDESLKILDKVNDDRKDDALRLKHKIFRTKMQKTQDPEKRASYISKSIQIAKELVKLDPSADNYYALGQDALFAGDMELAQPNLEKAANEGNGYAWYYLSFAYIRQGNLSQAEKACREAEPKLKASDDGQALKNLYCNWGHIYHVRDDLNSAITYYTKGGCEQQLELARQGKKAIEQQKQLEQLIQQFKEFGN